MLKVRKPAFRFESSWDPSLLEEATIHIFDQAALKRLVPPSSEVIFLNGDLKEEYRHCRSCLFNPTRELGEIFDSVGDLKVNIYGLVLRIGGQIHFFRPLNPGLTLQDSINREAQNFECA